MNKKETILPVGLTGIVKEIHVEKLFGQYTYNISINNASSPSVLILYGDNGTGKTTILKLIYSLLLPAGDGRKTFIAQMPFKHFSVALSNGVTVFAAKNNLIGGFRQTVIDRFGHEHAFVYETDPEGKVARSKVREVAEEKFDALLRSLEVNLHYLPDDRNVKYNVIPAENRIQQPHFEYSSIEARRAAYMKQKISSPLDVVSAQALEWARQQMISASRIGEDSTNNVYVKLIRGMAIARKGVPINTKKVQVGLVSKLFELTVENNEFAMMGLASPINSSEVQKILERNYSKQKPLWQVAELYISGIDARLKALQKFKNLLKIFLENINTFLVDKTMEFNLKQGFCIKNKGGESLDINKLSSGEKQLILLSLDTLVSSDHANIFIIDEPEISLNIKWQRKLLSTLCACLPEQKSQFILATHSISIISDFQDQTYQLKN